RQPQVVRIDHADLIAGSVEISFPLILAGVGEGIITVLDKRAEIIGRAGVGRPAAGEDAVAAGAVDVNDAATDAHELINAGNAPANVGRGVAWADDHVGRARQGAGNWVAV